MASNHWHLELNYMNKKSVYKLLMKARSLPYLLPYCWCRDFPHSENCQYIQRWVKDYEENYLAYHKTKKTTKKVSVGVTKND